MQLRSIKLLSSLLLLCLGLSATAVEPAAKSLELVGKGIRQKKVIFFNVDVYEAQFFVSDRASFLNSLKTQSPLDALSKMDAAELRMTFLRSVSATKIKESFGDALDANKVNRKSPTIEAFLKKIEESPSFDDKKKVTISADLKAGNLRYIDPEGKATTMKVSVQDIRDLFSIWLGNPADGGLETLKSALLGKTK